MNNAQLLDRLAQHRQHLDQTSRAQLPDVPDAVRESIALALVNLADACDLLATVTPSATPTDPWIGATMSDRLDPPVTAGV